MSENIEGPIRGDAGDSSRSPNSVWWTVAGSVVIALAVLALVVMIDGGADETSLDAGARPDSAGAPSSTRAPHPAPSSTSLREEGEACLGDELTDRQRLGQLVMVGVDPSSTSHAREVVEEHHVGGIFVGGDDPTLISSGILTELTGPAGIEPFVAVDDEGGRVQRIEMLVGDMPSARQLASSSSPDEIRRLAEERGAQLRSYGINVDFAPVLDVSEQADSEVIGDRSFGADSDTVTLHAEAFAVGLTRSDVMAVYKHFPGHGHAEGDSHLGTSRTPDIAEMGPDLAPFEALMGRHPNTAVMVGHLSVPGLTDGEPATISPSAIDGLLRDELGYDGLVFTDELAGMKAVSDRFGPSDAARLAITAGADVALLAHPTDVETLLDDLESSLTSGELDREVVDRALGRILRAKGHAC